MRSSSELRAWLPAIGAAIPMIILPVAILSIPLAAARSLGLSPEELSSWIAMLYGLPCILSLILAYRYQQPLLLTGNAFVLIFFASLEGQQSFAELIGASMLAGVGVVLVAVLGLTGRLTALIPTPIVLGLLAGAVLPFVVDVFTLLDDEPVLVGGTLLAFLLGHRSLGTRLPPILPALIAGVAIAAATGQIGGVPSGVPPPSLVLTWPEFSLEAIATVTPVLVILITLQSNVPSMIFLRNEQYRPPERTIHNVSGVSTAIGSFFGPTGVSLSLPATSLVGGIGAGERQYRHRAVYISGGAVLLVALLSGMAARLPTIVPLELLLSLAGLAVVGVLTHALREITRGPLTLGPILAFAISLSEISLFGFGPFFWALVAGTGVSMLVEREALQEIRDSRL